MLALVLRTARGAARRRRLNLRLFGDLLVMQAKIAPQALDRGAVTPYKPRAFSRIQVGEKNAPG